MSTSCLWRHGFAAFFIAVGLGKWTTAAAQTRGSSVAFDEDFDHPPPYDADIDAMDPGGWSVDTDPFPPFPPHNGFGNYARGHDLCGTPASRMLKLPATRLDLTGYASATLRLWAAHGVCMAGCPAPDSCRVAIQVSATAGGGFTEFLLLNFPDPEISGCGGPGAWEADLAFDLTPYAGSFVQVVVYHSTTTIDHLLIDDVSIEGVLECGSPSTYCTTSMNSVGAGSLIGFTGSTSVAANDFGLISTGNPPNKFGIYFMGSSPASIPFGNGTLCVASPHTRYPVITSNGSGVAAYAVDNTAPPAAGKIVAGSTWYWQFWYRDPMGGGAFFNLSNGLAVPYCP